MKSQLLSELRFYESFQGGGGWARLSAHFAERCAELEAVCTNPGTSREDWEKARMMVAAFREVLRWPDEMIKQVQHEISEEESG